MKIKNKKEIVFLIKVMCGGGAERVITLLSNATIQMGYDVTFIITHQSQKDSVITNMDPNIKILNLPDQNKQTKNHRFVKKTIYLFSRLCGKFESFILKKQPSKAKILRYIAENYSNIKWLKSFFKQHKHAVAVAFMYDASFYSLLSTSRNNKLIISERGDPQQSINSKTTMAFIKNEFCKADDFVFQSPDVKKWYEENTSVIGKVIFNPINPALPEPYSGERKKRIVNFCRISTQKNLIMLIDSFAKFHQNFPDYELDIIGDPVGNNVEGYIEAVNKHIKQHNCEDCIHIMPSRKDIHEFIKDYAMFVSSSDFEGMSNSMLEAMAMGIPCVCTDCPAGGARAVIKDGENGLLTPVGYAHALYLAMKKVAESPELASKLSQNSIKIREEQSVDKIIEKWMDIISK